ncbi:MAG TPA: glycerophosphodiester phosphodiesterase [Acidimicrobiales bacterium]|nr:glycerophosphodiester phosphodiesterase [Acidimicrobiales bacterium]
MTIGFAHRGARLEHPDNTLDGFARALQLGAAGLETDAWVTADGIAVLDHDGVLGRLRRTPLAALRRNELPSHIPTLADLYRLEGALGVDVSIDVKHPGAWPAVLAALGEVGGDPRRCWVCSDDVEALRRWRGAHPMVRLVHSTSTDRIGADRRPSADGAHHQVAAHARRLAAVGVDALNLRAPAWGPASVAACHDAGVAAFAWDAQTGPVLEALVAMGADAVYSDHVAVMVAVLAGT